MSDAATLTAGYVRRGLSPDAGVTYMLPRLVGQSRAADIILTGRDVDAAEAERTGLASRVVPADGFADAVAAYAKLVGDGPGKLGLFSGMVQTEALLAHQFADIPGTKDPDSVTLYEEERIMAFFGGGVLYATPERQEAIL